MSNGANITSGATTATVDGGRGMSSSTGGGSSSSSSGSSGSSGNMVRSRYGAALAEISEIVMPPASSSPRSSPSASPRQQQQPLVSVESRAGGEVALKSFDKILASVAAKQKKMRMHIRQGPEDELMAQKSRGGGRGGPATTAASTPGGELPTAEAIAESLGFLRPENDVEALRRRVERRDELICTLRRQLAQEAAPLHRDSEASRQESRCRIRDSIRDEALLSVELEDEIELLYRIVDAKDRAVEQFKHRIVADAARIKDLTERVDRVVVDSGERIRVLEYEKRSHLVALQGKDRVIERYQADRAAQNERIQMDDIRYKELEVAKRQVESKFAAALEDIEWLRRELDDRDEEIERREREKLDAASRMDRLAADYEEVKRRYDELWEKLDSLPPDSWLNNSYRSADSGGATSDDDRPESNQRAASSRSAARPHTRGAGTGSGAESSDAEGGRLFRRGRGGGIEPKPSSASQAPPIRKTVLTSRNKRKLSSMAKAKQDEADSQLNSANRINVPLQSFANAFSVDTTAIRWETPDGEVFSPMAPPSSAPMSIDKIANSIPLFSQTLPASMAAVKPENPPSPTSKPTISTPAAVAPTPSGQKGPVAKDINQKNAKLPIPVKGHKKAPHAEAESVQQTKHKPPAPESRTHPTDPSSKKHTVESAATTPSTKPQHISESAHAKVAEELQRANISLTVRVASLESTVKRVEEDAKADEKYFSNKIVNLTVENERLVAEHAAMEAKTKVAVSEAQHERDELRHTVSFLSEQLAQYMGAFHGDPTQVANDTAERDRDNDSNASDEENKESDTIHIQFMKPKSEGGGRRSSRSHEDASGIMRKNSTPYDVIAENLSQLMRSEVGNAVPEGPVDLVTKPDDIPTEDLNIANALTETAETETMEASAEVAAGDMIAIERPESAAATSRPQSKLENSSRPVSKSRPRTGRRASSARKDAGAWSSQLAVLCDSYDTMAAAVGEVDPGAILVHLQNFLVECKALSEVFVNKRKADEISEVYKVLLKFLTVIGDQVDTASMYLASKSNRLSDPDADNSKEEAGTAIDVPENSEYAALEDVTVPESSPGAPPAPQLTAQEQLEAEMQASLGIMGIRRGILNGSVLLSTLPPERPLSGKSSPPRRLSTMIRRASLVASGQSTTGASSDSVSPSRRKSTMSATVSEDPSSGIKLPDVNAAKAAKASEVNRKDFFLETPAPSTVPPRWQMNGPPDKDDASQPKGQRKHRGSVDNGSLSNVLAVSQLVSTDPVSSVPQPSDKYRASPRTRRISLASNAVTPASTEQSIKDAEVPVPSESMLQQEQQEDSAGQRVTYVDYKGGADQQQQWDGSSTNNAGGGNGEGRTHRDANDIALSDNED